MTVNELLQLSRDTLQDQEKNFWDDSELLKYYEEARRVIASHRNDKRLTQDVVMNAGTEFYSPLGVLRYISVKDDEGTDRPLYRNDGIDYEDTLGIAVIDYDQIQVIDDTVGSILTITYLGLPTKHNLNDDVRDGDVESCRYYILAKAYEKETDMENFAKSEKFEAKFEKMLKSLVTNSSLEYREERVLTTKSYSY